MNTTFQYYKYISFEAGLRKKKQKREKGKLEKIEMDCTQVNLKNIGPTSFNFVSICIKVPSPTILDKINGTSGPPLPPISMMPKWRALLFARLHHCLGGEGG